jgi:hypothetical protein
VKRRRNRNLRLALSLLGEGGLSVHAIVEGGRHTHIKLADGRVLLVSRGASQREHGALVLRHSIARLVRTAVRS